MVLTMAAVADHKGIKPERLAVRVARTTATGSSWSTSFTVHIDVGDGLSDRERTILHNAARNCEVGKLLAGELRFDYRPRSGSDNAG